MIEQISYIIKKWYLFIVDLHKEWTMVQHVSHVNSSRFFFMQQCCVIHLGRQYIYLAIPSDEGCTDHSIHTIHQSVMNQDHFLDVQICDKAFTGMWMLIKTQHICKPIECHPFCSNTAPCSNSDPMLLQKCSINSVPSIVFQILLHVPKVFQYCSKCSNTCSKSVPNTAPYPNWDISRPNRYSKNHLLL